MARTILKLAAPLVIGVGLLSAPAATAAPVVNALALKSATPSLVDTVQWRRRGWGGGWGRPAWHDGWGGWGPGWGWRRSAWGWGAGGFAAGALVGASLARPWSVYDPYYSSWGYAPRPVFAAAPGWGGRTVAWCAQRYRTYDPATGTFIGKGGRRIRCP